MTKLGATSALVSSVLAPTVIALPAQAHEGPCTTSAGVTVIVDASAIGGGILQRCADGEVTSGFDALTRAGYTWTPISRSPAMLCRIGDFPSLDVTDCAFEPPANAYWMYFRSSRGGVWGYSQQGAHTRPDPGGVEGWVFFTGSQREPGVAPPAALPPVTPTPAAPSPSATVRPTAAPKPQPTTPSTQPTPASGTSLSGQRTEAAPASPNPIGDQAGGAIRAQGPAEEPAPSGQLAVADPVDHGSPLSAIVGIGTAVMLVIIAAGYELRRRQTASKHL